MDHFGALFLGACGRGQDEHRGKRKPRRAMS